MAISLTRSQLRQVDQLAISQYGMSSLVLMENAGRGAAEIIHQQYGSENYRQAIVICGAGNNGGDGCVIARHLHNRHWQTTVLIAGNVSRLTPDTRANLTILEKMSLNITIATADAMIDYLSVDDHAKDIIIDCLLGTGCTGEVRSPTDALIHYINHIDKYAAVAIDMPSGLDCDSGKASIATIRADLTISFVARKRAFDLTQSASYTGRVEVTGIGVPKELIAQCDAMPKN